MKFISHRGNLKGKDILKENKKNTIKECLDLGLDVEIDVWLIENKFYLGHDKPEELTDIKFLENDSLWCHCKNKEAIFELIKNKNTHCFWHDTDKYTLTSKGIIWAFPGEKLSENSVCVLPELHNYDKIDLKNSYGICSDNILDYINL